MRSLDRLLHPAFLTALALLLLNDHVWKAVYGNWWTGKLSDFAGLFAWAWFWTVVAGALWPRWRSAPRYVHLGTAVAFVYWKHPISDDLVAWWSTYAWGIQRVADPTDLLAIVVLSISYLVLPQRSWQPTAFGQTGGAARYATVMLSLIAFVATSDGIVDVTYFNEEIRPIDSVFVVAAAPEEVLPRLRTPLEDGAAQLGECFTVLTTGDRLGAPPLSPTYELELEIARHQPVGTAIRLTRVANVRVIYDEGATTDAAIDVLVDTISRASYARAFERAVVRPLVTSPEGELNVFFQLCD